MSTKTRIQKIENAKANDAKDKKIMTWKQFIESDGEEWDAKEKAAWEKFIADNERENINDKKV